jgi:hypothetical protein
MLDPANPLSVYEIFYLRDVLSEDIGSRTQGAWIQIVAGFDENRASSGGRKSVAPRRSLGLAASWDHNLTLNHQLRATGAIDYVAASGGSRRNETLAGRIGLAHLWTIADRYRWDNSLTFRTGYVEDVSPANETVRRDYVTTLGSEFRVFVEDRLAVLASIRGENDHQYAELVEPSNLEQYRRRWAWTYGIGLEYRLDSYLY